MARRLPIDAPSPFNSGRVVQPSHPHALTAVVTQDSVHPVGESVPHSPTQPTVSTCVPLVHPTADRHATDQASQERARALYYCSVFPIPAAALSTLCIVPGHRPAETCNSSATQGPLSMRLPPSLLCPFANAVPNSENLEPRFVSIPIQLISHVFPCTSTRVWPQRRPHRPSTQEPRNHRPPPTHGPPDPPAPSLPVRSLLPYPLRRRFAASMRAPLPLVCYGVITLRNALKRLVAVAADLRPLSP